MARRRLSRVLGPVLGALVILGVPSPAPAAPEADDPYLAGYAGAVLEREFKLSRRAVTVRNGVLTVEGAQLAGADRARVLAVLSSLPGVVSVEVREAAAPWPAVSPGAAPAAVSALPTGLLPTGHLFQPMLADPRWPHFSAAYRYYLGHPDLAHVAAVSFGETIPLIRDHTSGDSQLEIGVQAGVFALFQLDAPSEDLINADYFVALYGAWRRGPVSVLGRVFHQSSHVGDELLLRTRLERINLSYESVDLKLAYDLPWGFRVYGGGGYLFDQEPATVNPWTVQGGLEFRSPWTLAADRIRPVAAIDLQSRDENQWNLDLSVRAGIQLESVRVLERRLQLLVEYFYGNSPDGQFYKRRVDYIGLGAHFHF
jgi:hypothetical protein